VKKLTIAIVLCVFAGVAVAHDGVMNPKVKARMDTMVVLKDNIQLLGKMANGAIAFDAALAAQAREKLVAASAVIAPEFQAPEMDPKSEAKPQIWENWADFEIKAKASIDGANAIQPDSLNALQLSLKPMGDSCQSCHKAYRVKK